MPHVVIAAVADQIFPRERLPELKPEIARSCVSAAFRMSPNPELRNIGAVRQLRPRRGVRHNQIQKLHEETPWQRTAIRTARRRAESCWATHGLIVPSPIATNSMPISLTRSRAMSGAISGLGQASISGRDDSWPSCMMALNRWEEFRLHVIGGFNTGDITKNDLKEIILQGTVYCGAPVGNRAMKEAAVALKDAGQ